MITSPATIVGSANGRSMIALMTDLPANESRTSTHAMIVPNTAVVSTASVDIASVSLRAETASGDETTCQNPDQPRSAAFEATAAIGSTTMIRRNVVTRPTCRERADETLSLRWAAGAGSPGASVMLLADTLLAGRDAERLSIFCMMLLVGSNHFLSTARQPPSSGLVIVVWPGRTGYLLPASASAFLSTGRYPLSARIFCAGYVFR